MATPRDGAKRRELSQEVMALGPLQKGSSGKDTTFCAFTLGSPVSKTVRKIHLWAFKYPTSGIVFYIKKSYGETLVF